MRPENLLQRLLPTQRCTIGCPVVESFLGGGIPCNSITKFVSESGCAKTQLCLQVLFSAQLPLALNGLAASSLYLYSEFPYPFRRLHQLRDSFKSSHPNLFDSQEPLDHIFVHPLYSADDLLDVLLQIDHFLANPTTRLPIKLIVIDSIAALFRSEFENTPYDLKRRSALFFKISAKLKSHAERFGLAVVVTNQVVDYVESSDGLNGVRVGNLGCMYSSGRRICPALGLSWASCVNSRLFISRNVGIEAQENSLVDVGCSDFVNSQRKRQLHVIFAPHLPYSSCEFVITREGVSGVDTER